MSSAYFSELEDFATKPLDHSLDEQKARILVEQLQDNLQDKLMPIKKIEREPEPDDYCDCDYCGNNFKDPEFTTEFLYKKIIELQDKLSNLERRLDNFKI